MQILYSADENKFSHRIFVFYIPCIEKTLSGTALRHFSQIHKNSPTGCRGTDILLHHFCYSDILDLLRAERCFNFQYALTAFFLGYVNIGL